MTIPQMIANVLLLLLLPLWLPIFFLVGLIKDIWGTQDDLDWPGM